MKKLIVLILIFGLAFQALAINSSALESRDERVSSIPILNQDEYSLLVVECEGSYELSIIDKRFRTVKPLGYVDGMSLYGGYFAQWMAMDPEGTDTWLCPDLCTLSTSPISVENPKYYFKWGTSNTALVGDEINDMIEVTEYMSVAAGVSHGKTGIITGQNRARKKTAINVLDKIRKLQPDIERNGRITEYLTVVVIIEFECCENVWCCGFTWRNKPVKGQKAKGKASGFKDKMNDLIISALKDARAEIGCKK